MIIAIDGPGGSGKSTIAKKVASKKGIIYLDTGAMFRTISFYFKQNNIDYSNKKNISSIVENIDISYFNGSFLLNGVDVSDEIRTPEVTKIVSEIASLKEIREKLLLLQRKIASTEDCILDGRDIGTVVFPNADVKIFLTADLEERAKRRYQENLGTSNEQKYEVIYEEIKSRDYKDENRKIAPLKKASDAIVINSTSYTIEEVTNKILEIIEG